MSLQALKEPITTASRRRLHQPPSPPRRQFNSSKSRILAALDVQMASLGIVPPAQLRQEQEKGEVERIAGADADSSVEIIGPIVRVINAKPRVQTKKATQPLHPFFLTANATSTSKSSTTLNANANTAPPVPKAKSAAAEPAKKDSTVSKSRSKSKSKDAPDPTQPIYSYRSYTPTPAVVYTRHEDEANDLVKSLHGPIGFDMEWRVFWRSNAPERRTGLVQLADEKMILLVQVSAMQRFPQKVKEIIESPDVLKLGANINNDGEKLFRDFGIRAAGLVELGAVARDADPCFPFYARSASAIASTTTEPSTANAPNGSKKRTIVALAKLVSRYTGHTLVKGKERTGNWEGELGESMIEYAANDAHCALMVYNRLLQFAKSSGRAVNPAGIARAVSPPSPSGPVSAGTTVETETERTERPPPRPQHIRAYNLWYHRHAPLESICATLRSAEEPLKASTVISYVIEALKSDSALPFEMARLVELVQMEAGSWQRHRSWLETAEAEGRGK